MADWFYGKDGTQHGPVSDHEIGGLLQSGQIDGTTIIWREGMADWLPLSQVPEFQSTVAPATIRGGNATPAAASPYTTPSAATAATAAPAAYAAPAPTDGLSIASLVCGIMAIISCYIWGLFGLPAVICGHMSLKKINNSPTPVAGKGMAIAGLICGYIGIVFQLAMIIGGIFFFMNAKDQSKRQQQLIESEMQNARDAEELRQRSNNESIQEASGAAQPQAAEE
jgi:hypothetical protein